MEKGGYFKKRRRKNNIEGWLFMLPAIISFTVFVGISLIMTFVLSSGKYNLLQSFEFTGLNNVKRFMIDKTAHQALQNTGKYFLIFVPIHCIGALILAYLVYQINHTRVRNIVRNIIYYPTIITTASVVLAWKYMFAGETGFVNYFIRMLGGEGINWLGMEYYYLSVALFSAWKFIGTTFLYYFVGIRNVPKTYYEAAQIDGASKFGIFTKIILPLMTPTIFFVFVTNVIGVIQTFDEPFLLRNATDTKSFAVYIYESAFINMKFGYAGLLALILFVIILIITLIQFAGQRKWVNYDYE